MSVRLFATLAVLAARCRVSPAKRATRMKTRSYSLPNSLFRPLYSERKTECFASCCAF